MAKTNGLGQAFYAHGYDITGDVGAVEEASINVETLDVTALDKSAMERVLGRVDSTMAYRSFFNDAAGQAHPGLSGLPTTDVLESWLIGGTTANTTALQLLSRRVEPYSVQRGRDGAAEQLTRAMANGSPLEDAVSVTAGQVTHASATSSTSIDENGATGDSSEGGVGFLQFFERDSGTPTFVLEDSSNDSTWATLITFTNTGGATPFGERATVTGAVGRYLRATTTGTFTNADFYMAFRRGTTVDRVDLS